MIRKYFKKLVYLIVITGVSSAIAGSYEDFFRAVVRDDAGAVTELLNRGFDAHSRDPKGQTGLALALQGDSLKVAAALVGHPALDVNALNDNGESALMLVAMKGELELARRLLARGAALNLPGWAPLHYAASGPGTKVVELLIERGADVNAGSPNGSTPLMMAARYGSEDSVALLLARGADPKRRNERELTAADFARLGGREALAARLAQAAR